MAPRRSGPMPRRSATPGRKFSTTTSAWRASASTSSRAAALFKSSTKLFLPRFITENRALSPFFMGPMAR